MELNDTSSCGLDVSHGIEIKLSHVHILDNSQSPSIHVEEFHGDDPDPMKTDVEPELECCNSQGDGASYEGYEPDTTKPDHLSVSNRSWLRRRSDPGDYDSDRRNRMQMLDRTEDCHMRMAKEQMRLACSSHNIAGSNRMVNPRLMVIRSASPENCPDAADEEGEASRLSPLCHPRWANRAKSLPVSNLLLAPTEADAPCDMEALHRLRKNYHDDDEINDSTLNPSWIEKMKRKSSLLLSPPEAAAGAVSRRRRSVSLECSPLESIEEELGGTQKSTTRRYSITAPDSKYPMPNIRF